ncbi:NUDIX domain-containing protein [Tsuneonella sp. YG55]|uniref:NUDIX domain-containing protein n=1 Tax=Tsuneonella litorea TaxID=2976475 RepID=A0A9X3ALK1_9SPHN|nr:NUDIX domain-containing protein [Tsuneonella litorea]MCT2559864.1 NUDIX domain-containing protein [Tsuneonella litorea]
MLRLIPRPIHRIALRVAHAVRHRWRRLVKLPLAGVSVIVTDMEGRVLLVRHSYGPGGWALPGGGMGRREEPLAAAAREVHEEIGCVLESGRVLDRIEETVSGAPHTAWLVAGTTRDYPVPDRREVIEARFFPLHSLPEPQSDLTRKRIAAWRESLR